MSNETKKMRPLREIVRGIENGIDRACDASNYPGHDDRVNVAELANLLQDVRQLLQVLVRHVHMHEDEDARRHSILAVADE